VSFYPYSCPISQKLHRLMFIYIYIYIYIYISQDNVYDWIWWQRNKINIFLAHLMDAYGGGEVWPRWGDEWLTSRPGRFIPRKRTLVYIDHETSSTPDPVWMFWRREKKPLAPFGTRSPHCSPRNLVTVRLRCSGYPLKVNNVVK